MDFNSQNIAESIYARLSLMKNLQEAQESNKIIIQDLIAANSDLKKEKDNIEADTKKIYDQIRLIKEEHNKTINNQDIELQHLKESENEVSCSQAEELYNADLRERELAAAGENLEHFHSLFRKEKELRESQDKLISSALSKLHKKMKVTKMTLLKELIGEFSKRCEALNQSVSRMTEMVESYKKREVEQETEIRELKEKIALDSARLSASRAMHSSLEAISSKVFSDLKQNIQEARLLCDDKDRELEELSNRFTRFLQLENRCEAASANVDEIDAIAAEYEVFKTDELLKLNAVREEIAALKESARLDEEQKALAAEKRKAEIAAVIAGREEALGNLREEQHAAKDGAPSADGAGASETTRMNDSEIEPQQADNSDNNP